MELELQIQKEKLSATAKDSEFMRENLSSRITALEGTQYVTCTHDNDDDDNQILAQLSGKEKQLKDQVSHLQQSHQKEVRG